MTNLSTDAPLMTWKLLAVLFFVVLSTVTLFAADPAGDEPIDWTKAQQLYRRERSGEKLSTDDAAYLERAKQARAQGQGPNAAGRNGAATRPASRPAGDRPTSPAPRESIGLKPLTEMSATDRYKDQDGGLYGKGENTLPKPHLDAAIAASKRIQPLDVDGKPSPDGKIALISLGMSNTTMEFSAFTLLANADKDKSPKLTIVDCAQGGMDAPSWSNPDARRRKGRPSPWEEMDDRLKKAEISPAQVQAVWIKQAIAGPQTLGDFPKHAQAMQEDLAKIVRMLKQRFPNLQLAYFSSRIYAGYATSLLNPEPYAYEGAFSIRWLIQDQMAGKGDLNYDPSKGEVKAPILLWGPYLWADGMTPRKSDGLTYTRQDLKETDGTHPSPSAQQKIARMLLDFFKSDPTAKPWFVSAP